MRSAAALLTLVASLLVHHPVTVLCTAPPGDPWRGLVWGVTDKRRRIWLRHCTLTTRRNVSAEIVFGHEILHIRHPDWPHSLIYPASYAYRFVVDRAIVAAERKHA